MAPFNPEDIFDPLRLVKQGYKPMRQLYGPITRSLYIKKTHIFRDLVLIQDTTASLEENINASLVCCAEICNTLKDSGLLRKDDGLRLALLAFRDYEDEYLIKDFGGFTDKVDTIVSNLKSLNAGGGGDGPEAITPALEKALYLDWRKDAVKLAILITDAPPHAIGEKDDYYLDKDPSGKFP
jgi:Mg-chelatase subunit ChlD